MDGQSNQKMDEIQRCGYKLHIKHLDETSKEKSAQKPKINKSPQTKTENDSDCKIQKFQI